MEEELSDLLMAEVEVRVKKRVKCNGRMEDMGELSIQFGSLEALNTPARVAWAPAGGRYGFAVQRMTALGASPCYSAAFGAPPGHPQEGKTAGQALSAADAS